MRPVISSRRRVGVIATLTAVITLATAAGTTGTAHAALSGTDWTTQALPANYLVGDGMDGPPISPVSCVPGTQFCLALPSDSASLVNIDHIGQAALVTTDSGKSWTGYASLPPSMLEVVGASCASVSVCWVTGYGTFAEPVVAESTDSGHTWTDKTPSDWANPRWLANAISCPTASTCWVAGRDFTTGHYQPLLLKTTDGGASWQKVSGLPAFNSGTTLGSYVLNGISCVSASSCVAVGGLNYIQGTAVSIMTADGGASWSLSSFPGVQSLWSVSCPIGAGHACFAAGGVIVTGNSSASVFVASSDSGKTWGNQHVFANGGWFTSISCANPGHCWAATAATAQALAGTADGGASWSTVTSDTTNEYGSVSCLNVSVCVATTDNALWVTTDNGGIEG
jgi:hypothetical protein